MLLIVLLLLVIGRISTSDDITCIYDAQNVCANCTILYNMENITEISSNSATDMTIYINTIELQEVIMISNKSSLVISGMKSIIKCSKNGIGLYLRNITNLEMHDMEFAYCGANIYDDRLGMINFSVLIRYCTDITIANVNITNSEKTGLAMLQNGGMILIKQSNFMNNGNWEKSEEDCDVNEREIDKCYRGGGLQIEDAYDMKILDCVFVNNSACLGGGINIILYHDYQENSSLLLRGSNFSKNNAYYGGGLRIQFKYTSCSTIYNSSIILNTCEWTNNSAFGGAAIDIFQNNGFSYILPKVEMINCSYTSNKIIAINSQDSRRCDAGILWIRTLNIAFHGKHDFADNNITAMYLQHAKVHFHSGSDVIFMRNRGTKGGAIHLSDSSVMFIEDNSTFYFSNNTATEKGAAIYHHVKSHPTFSSSNKCLLQYRGDQNEVSDRKIEFIFENNIVENSNHKKNVSLYISTLKPCREHQTNCLEKNILCCIANFTFMNDEISTSGDKINTDKNELFVIPGYRAKLPVKLLNELGREIPAQFSVSLTSHDESNIEIDEAYMFTSHNWIKILGKPGIKATLRLVHSEVWTITTEINVTLQECPPGYVLRGRKCVCSVKEKENLYACIKSCNDTTFTATIKHGYWMGYSNIGKNKIFGKEDDLVYAFCPLTHCFNELNGTRRRDLQKDTNKTALDYLVCGETRTGKLCSHCRGKNAVHFNSYRFTCKEDNSCSLGWLYYILSEIIPVTILFSILIIFDIELSKGAVNGLILYLQISDNTLKEAEFLVHSPILKTIIDIYKFIAQIFNLNFFEFEGTSFCIWKKAKVLDIIAFKYVTALYSLLLVVAVICIMKFCYGRRMRCTSATRKFSVKGTIICGISSFLILSYSKCIKISIRLLTGVPLYKKEGEIYKAVSFYDGELTFFQGLHLVYALPALLIILTLGVVPPMLLISYPACYRILAFFKINETKFSNYLCKIVPLEKLKPFFDSFQRSFKDEYRFFSGLYFVYRIILVAPFMLVYDIAYFYLIMQIGLALILTAHAIFQPYKNKWHNISDGLLLMILIIVNAMAVLSYHFSIRNLNHKNYATVFSSIGIALLYTPFVSIVIYYCKMIAYKLRNKYLSYQRRSSDYIEYDASDSILLEAVEERIAEISTTNMSSSVKSDS